jgi:hypothetical protein
MTTTETALCPYCQIHTTIELPDDYAPVFVYCGGCRKKFIAERRAQGFEVFRTEGAPCCSDPDCREIEMGSVDEQ